MLAIRTVLDRDGVVLSDVACRHDRGEGATSEQAGRHAIVLVRRGCFARIADGSRQLLDPSVAYASAPGQEERYDHPHRHGDDCTRIALNAGLLESLRGGERSVPAAIIPIDAECDLRHRLLVAGARTGEDAHEIVERVIALVAAVLRKADPARNASGRPSTRAAHRRLADDAREALAVDLDASLPELARRVGTSPHHLSRTFAAVSGTTVSEHRRRLRARHALERLTGGEDDLARLAADVGFADQSHLTRVLRRQTGRTPSALRPLLAPLERSSPLERLRGR